MKRRISEQANARRNEDGLSAPPRRRVSSVSCKTWSPFGSWTSAISSAEKRKTPQDPQAGVERDDDDDDFRRWLERKLHELYDPIVHEPLPDNIEDALARLPKRDKED